jgi:hypothetical protein
MHVQSICKTHTLFIPTCSGRRPPSLGSKPWRMFNSKPIKASFHTHTHTHTHTHIYISKFRNDIIITLLIIIHNISAYCRIIYNMLMYFAVDGLTCRSEDCICCVYIFYVEIVGFYNEKHIVLHGINNINITHLKFKPEKLPSFRGLHVRHVCCAESETRQVSLAARAELPTSFPLLTYPCLPKAFHYYPFVPLWFQPVCRVVVN